MFGNENTSICWPGRYDKFRVERTSAVKKLFKKKAVAGVKLPTYFWPSYLFMELTFQ